MSFDFLKTVRAYLDAMIEHGRDRYGPGPTPLFLSLLDRRTMAPPREIPARAIDIIRPNDRVIPFGTNVQYDVGLYAALYTMSKLTGESRYHEAADASLRWFCDSCRVHHGLFAWGTHIHWNCVTRRCVVRKPQNPNHELWCRWPFWEDFWRLSPSETEAFSRALWEKQILDHETGEFDRHYPPNRGDRKDFPSMAGRYIHAWGWAFMKTRDGRFLDYIRVLLARYERRRHPATGLIPACEAYGSCCWANDVADMAVSCEKAASLVPPPLSERLRQFARSCDKAYLRVRNDPSAGILLSACECADGSAWTGKDQAGPMGHWGYYTMAGTALSCWQRHRATGDPGLGRLAKESADFYQSRGIPAAGIELLPGAFADVVQLHLAVYLSTGENLYLDHAKRFGASAVELFWDDGPLPRASTLTDHYESITGGSRLAYALLCLHQCIQGRRLDLVLEGPI